MWGDEYYDNEPSKYEVGQVCENGHAINGSSQSSPQFNQKHCDKCGAKTITECPSCNTPIRGDYVSPEVILPGTYIPPAYCHNCGKPFPWTTLRIESAIELMQEEYPDETETLKQSINDIIQDTPRTQLGVSRFKKIMARVGAETAGALRDILVDIVSETAKKSIWG